MKIAVRLALRPYTVHIGAGLLPRLPRLLSRIVAGRRVAMAYDPGAACHARALRAALLEAGWSVAALALPRGEAAKRLEAVARVWSWLLKAGVDRRTPLIAVGGGAVGDAAGFAAATYFRGIPLVQVPTTLLAQVDSSVGGKTAIDHPKLKNAIGAFHQPALVLADIDTLRSLPRRELLAGLAEVVKCALIFDPAFARWLDRRWDALVALEPRASVYAIGRAVAWKARVVREDERDLTGRRELLNFGHTFGHALEAAAGFGSLRHGEAVAWGMRVAVALALARGGLTDVKEQALVGRLLDRLPRARWPRASFARLERLMRADKKAVGGHHVFVLLQALGQPVRVGDISRAELRAAVVRLRGSAAERTAPV